MHLGASVHVVDVDAVRERILPVIRLARYGQQTGVPETASSKLTLDDSNRSRAGAFHIHVAVVAGRLGTPLVRQNEQDIRAWDCLTQHRWSGGKRGQSGLKETPVCPRSFHSFNSIQKLVEAAGVEPASEKARHEKTTCVSGSVVFGRHIRTGKSAAA